MLLTLDGSGPLHRQVYGAVRRAILEGRLRPGDRLPSTRSLAAELGVSRTVTVRAYETLEVEGYVEGRVGAGTFVRDDLPEERLRSRRGPGREDAEAPHARIRLSAWARRALGGAGTGADAERAGSDPLRDPGRRHGSLPFDFRYGRPDPSFLPAGEWRRTVGRRARSPTREYGDPGGSAELREALSGHLARTRGLRCRPEQVFVVTGSQQALDLVARVLLDPGDRVVMEEPHYPGARDVFRAAGAEIVPVGVDREGLRVAELPRDGPAPRLVAVTPSHHFPLGGILSLSRRMGLLEWAEERDAVVLEDDYDGEFRHGAPPLEAIQALDRRGRVLHAGTFSKVLFPALRLGYLVVPPALVRPFRAAKWLADRHGPLLQQEALADLISDGTFERHLRRSRTRLGRRRTALLEALERELGDRVEVAGAEAGVHVVAWLRGLPPTALPRLAEEAARDGVGVYPLTPYYLGEPPGSGLLVGYGTLEEAAIREGIRRLRRALDRCEGRR